MSYYGFPAYVSVSEKRDKADRLLKRNKNKDWEPILLEGSAIAKTWWGKVWNQNLESYSDYANRIPRGRSYVRNHAVLDLKITEGLITGLVLGSSSKPYEVTIRIDPLEDKRWQRITNLCNRKLDSLEQLTESKFPKELEVLFKERTYGLFPSNKEIHFSCSCPDSAYLCKHIAAVLYGVGARLDAAPLLFFQLRGVDCGELIRKSLESRLNSMLEHAWDKSNRTIPEEELGDLFGI